MRILVIGARTWGRLGNFAAAQNIAKLVANHPKVSVTVHAAEDFWPGFAGWGDQMRSAAGKASALETAQAFEKILRRVEHRMSRGIGDGSDGSGPVGAFATFLRQENPDHVIATKGLITRFAAAARRTTGQSFSLTNWVTNSGLLTIACHKADEADRHVVPLPEDRDLLVREWGVDPAAVRAIGPLIRIGRDTPPAEMAERRLPVRRALFYFHVLTTTATAQVAELLGHQDPIECVVLHSHAEKRAVVELDSLAQVYPDRLTCKGELSQQKFHDLFQWLKQAESHAFVAKSGPNTMFEAMNLNLPMILYRSGLPQEDWVLDYLARKTVGVGVFEQASLAAAMRGLLDEPDRQRRIVEHQREELTRMAEQVDLKPRDLTRWMLAC